MALSDKSANRIQTVCVSLFKDVGRVYESDTQLVGIVELRNGQHAQLHLTLTSNENDFIDEDEPTGCADDLVVTQQDWQVV